MRNYISAICAVLVLFVLFVFVTACTKINTPTPVAINTDGEINNAINQTITAGSGSLLGYDVAMDNNYAIAGDPFHSELFATRRGRIHIYNRSASGPSWTERAVIKHPYGKSEDNFGIHVTIKGNYAASCTNDSIYVYKRILGENWVLQATLYPKNLPADSLAVSDMELYGDFLVVGQGNRKVNGNISVGCVYFFKKTNDKWAYHSTKFSPNNQEYDRFGSSVSIHGNFTLIGSRGEKGGHGGKAYAYINFLDNWNLQRTLVPADIVELDNYGGSVSLRGQYAIVGASQSSMYGDDYGKAYIYKREGAEWIQQAKLLSSDNMLHGHFGLSVAINDNYALIGGDAVHPGTVYTFKRLGNSWNFLRKDISPDPGSSNFGHHIAMDSTRHYIAADYGFISFGTHY